MPVKELGPLFQDMGPGILKEINLGVY